MPKFPAFLSKLKLPVGGLYATRVLSGGAWALAGKIVSVIAGLIAHAILARLVSPSEIGAYFLMASVVAAGAGLGQAGLSQTIVREVAGALGLDKQGRARRAVVLSVTLGLGTSLLVAALTVLGPGRALAERVFDAPLMVALLNLMAIWIIVTVIQRISAEGFRGFHDIRLATITGGTLGSALTAVLYAAVALGGEQTSLHQMVLLAVAADSFAALLMLWLLHRRIRPLRGDSDLTPGFLLKESFPQLVNSFAFLALAQANIWILGAFGSKSDVALLGATTKLIAMVFMPLLLVNAVLPPIIAEMNQQGKAEALQKVLRTTATLAGIPALMVLLGFAVFGKPLLGFVYGPFFEQGALVLALLGLGQMFSAWAGSCGLTLIMTGHQRTASTVSVASGIVSILLALALVRPYGLIGVACASSIGVALLNLALVLAAKWRTGIWTHISIRAFVRIIKYRDFGFPEATSDAPTK